MQQAHRGRGGGGRGGGFRGGRSDPAIQRGDKAHTSAVALIPPEDKWVQIQAIRSKFDKAYERWPPHINLLYPFLPEAQFADAAPKLASALSGIQPFTIRFDHFGMFSQGKNGVTVHLKPNDEAIKSLRAVQTAMEKAFPICDDLSKISADGFHPHLTVGQWPSKAEADAAIAGYMSHWNAIEFTLSEICIIGRTQTTPFVIKHRIPLGGIGVVSEVQRSSPPRASCATNVSFQEEEADLEDVNGPGEIRLSPTTPLVSVIVPEQPAYSLPSSSFSPLTLEPASSPSPPSKPSRYQFGMRRGDAASVTAPRRRFGMPAAEPTAPLTTEVEHAEHPVPSALPVLYTPQEVRILPHPKFGALLDRLTKWYHTSKSRHQLPKTREKLVNAVGPLCIAFEDVPLQKVYDYLVSLRFFNVTTTAAVKGRGKAPPQPPKQKLLYIQPNRLSFIEAQKTNSELASGLSREQAAAAELQKPALEIVKARAAIWLATCKEPPTSLEGLKHSVEQLCHVKRQLNASEVVDWLQQCHLLMLHTDDTVVYNFKDE